MITTMCPEKTCGVQFSIPDHVYNQCLRVGTERWIWCPNGHQSHWTEDNEAKLKKRIEELEATVERKEHLVDSLEGDITRLERRVSYWKSIAHRRRK